MAVKAAVTGEDIIWNCLGLLFGIWVIAYIVAMEGVRRERNEAGLYYVQLDAKPEVQANRQLLKNLREFDILEFKEGMACIVTEVTSRGEERKPSIVALQCGNSPGDRWEGGGMYDRHAFEFGMTQLARFMKRIVTPENPDYVLLAQKIRDTSAHGKSPAPRYRPKNE